MRCQPQRRFYVLPVVQHLHPLGCILLTFPLRIHWHSGKVCLDKTTYCLYTLCCVLLVICKLYMRTENNEILVFRAASNYQADSELPFVWHLCRRAKLISLFNFFARINFSHVILLSVMNTHISMSRSVNTPIYASSPCVYLYSVRQKE